MSEEASKLLEELVALKEPYQDCGCGMSTTDDVRQRWKNKYTAMLSGLDNELQIEKLRDMINGFKRKKEGI
jgi:hypothetical protein